MNASGQTAADLAHAHGFHEGFFLLSKSQKHLQQLSGVHTNGEQNGNSTLCVQEVLSRKRLLTAADTGHMKKARRADNVLQNGGGDGLESMNIESAEEMDSDDNTKAITNGHHHTLPYTDKQDRDPAGSPASPSPPPANQQAAPPTRHSSSNMCGSLHLTGSPSSCVSHRPAWRGPLGMDYMDLHYGHYHGFGDTAEELSDSSRLDHSSSIKAEQRYKQAFASSLHLYHGS